MKYTIKDQCSDDYTVITITADQNFTIDKSIAKLKVISKMKSDSYSCEVSYYKFGLLHRTDGPAHLIIYADNTIALELWYLNGEICRFDGPASIDYPQCEPNIDWNNNPTNECVELITLDWYAKSKIIKTDFNNWPLTTEQQVEFKLMTV